MSVWRLKSPLRRSPSCPPLNDTILTTCLSGSLCLSEWSQINDLQQIIRVNKTIQKQQNQQQRTYHMQPAKNPKANSSSAALKRKEQLATAGTYQTTFSNRDMTVNKQYAKYLERFGNMGTPQKEDLVPSEATQQENLADHTRRAEVDSRSPELADDMMMESTGMQRSMPKAQAADKRESQRSQLIQQRMQNLSANLGQVAGGQSAQNNLFKGSFQRAPISPKPENQPEKPRQSLEAQNIDFGQSPASQSTPKVAQSNPSIATPSVDSSHNRLKMKLADFLSPNAASSQKVALFPTSATKSTPQKETGVSTLARIKRRDYARKLFTAMEQNWVPSLMRVKSDTFQTIKNSDQQQSNPAGHNEKDLAEQYASIQSFGGPSSNGHFGISAVAAADVTHSAQTAKFDTEEQQQLTQEDGDEELKIVEESERESISEREKLSRMKQNFMTPALSSIEQIPGSSDWHISTRKHAQSALESVSKSTTNGDKTKLFAEIEQVQKSKFEALDLLPELRSSAVDESLQPQQMKTTDFELTNSGRETISPAAQHYDHVRPDSTANLTQQCASLDEAYAAMQHPVKTKPMLSPITAGNRTGFQYPSGCSNNSNERDYRRMHPMENSAPKLFNKGGTTVGAEGDPHNMRFLEHELGEAPMSMQPTDFEQTNDSQSQMMFTSNPDLRTMLDLQNQEEGATTMRHLTDNKTVQMFHRMQDGATQQKNAADIDTSGLGPMRLEFLQEEPMRKNQRREDDDATQPAALPLQDDQCAAKQALDTVNGLFSGDSTTQSQQVEGKSRKLLDTLQPIKSVFQSNNMIAKANQVRQEVNDRMAKIKAMQEDFLRRPRECKSKSSVRSGRQMSDQDFDKLSRELGQGIKLKKFSTSDAGSEDNGSELGDGHLQTENNPATVEYFVGPELSGHRQRKHEGMGGRGRYSSKNSVDLNSFGVANQQALLTPRDMQSEGIPQLYTGPQSVDFEEMRPPQSLEIEEKKNQQLTKLKVQNGLLILGNRISKHSTVVKQVYLSRWVQKVRRQRHLMMRLAHYMRKQVVVTNELAIRMALQEWKMFKDMKLQEEIAEEFNQVQLMQKHLLVGIQKSFTSKREQQTLAKHFHALLDLYTQRKKTEQGCKRIERLMRRQVRKRMRNFWKALSQQPCVSDLALEEVSLFSGNVPSSNGLVLRNTQPSPLLGVGDISHMRSASVHDCNTPQTMSPRNSRQTISGIQGTSSIDLETKLAQIKSAARLSTFCIHRLLNQTKQPSVADLFRIWKTLAHLHSKNPTSCAAVELPEISEFYNHANGPQNQQFNNGSNLSRQAKQTHFSKSMRSMPTDKRALNQAGVDGAEVLVGPPPVPSKMQQKQSSGTALPSKAIDEVYEVGAQHSQAKKSAQGIPEHEMRADMLGMLDGPAASQFSDTTPAQTSPLSSTSPKLLPPAKEEQKPAAIQEAPKTLAQVAHQREDILTASDISSVDLDSDDSCFAATVEVIKLAPVKKTQQEEVDYRHLASPEAVQPLGQEMPSTTNVSQNDHQHMRASQENLQDVDPQSEQQIDTPRINVGSLDKYSQNEVQPQSVKNGRIPPQNEPVRKKKASKPIRPSFNTNALLSEKVGIATPRNDQNAFARDGAQTSPAKSKMRQKNSAITRSDASLREQQSAAEDSLTSGVNAYGLRKPSQFFGGQKSSLGGVSSQKPLSQSSQDPLKRDIDTPKFRRSLVSNRQKPVNVVPPMNGYYELGQKAAPSKQKVRKPSTARVPSTRGALKGKQAVPQKASLMQKLAKVAEAQIAADIAMQEEKQKEKNRQLNKDLERKTSLMFKKKNLRGSNVPTQQTAAPFAYPQASQLLAKMRPQLSEQSKKTKSTVKSSISKHSLSRDQSYKGSFTSQPAQPKNFVSPWASQNPAHRSAVVSPRNRAGSKVSKKSHRQSSTAQATPNKKKEVKKVDIQACIKNDIKVKMPFGTIQNSMPILPYSARTSNTASQLNHPLYGQMSTNPFKAKKSTRKAKGERDIDRTASKSSLRSISDRPLKKTYEPPVYKSRAFRSKKNQQSDKNDDLTTFSQQQQSTGLPPMLLTGSEDMMLKTQPQIMLDEQDFQSLQERQQQRSVEELVDLKNGLQYNGDDVQDFGHSDQPTNIVFAAQAEQTQQNLHEMFQIDKIDSENNQIDLAPQINEAAAELEEIISGQNTAKKALEAQEQPTPDWLTQSIGRNIAKPPQYRSAQHRGRPGQSDEMPNLGSNQDSAHKLHNPNRNLAMSQEMVQGASDHEFIASSGNNFTLGKRSDQNSQQKELPDHLINNLQSIDGGRRLTFGRDSNPHQQAQFFQNQAQIAALQHNQYETEEALERVNAGLERLARAVTPRVERYKVELFIYLCEALDQAASGSEQNDGDFYSHDGGAVEQMVDQVSSEEDVYGNSKYMRPRNLSNNNPGDAQQFQGYHY